ncbi:hypothetical protein ACROYT_G031981 [Oculina patagonica]
MSVLALKDRIELASGIPRHLQRLTYFDDLDIDDKKRLSFYHVVPNSIVRVKWWPEWDGLIRAAYYGDVRGVMASRIRATMPGQGWFRKIIFNERGYVALFIACHQGHARVVSKLMSLDIDPTRKMPSGRSAIHVAVHNKRIACVNLLVGKSRGVKEEEKYRENCVRRNTFLNICNQLQRKDGWRLLVMQLKERMGRRESDDTSKGVIPLREFQKYDSAFSANFKDGAISTTTYSCTLEVKKSKGSLLL